MSKNEGEVAKCGDFPLIPLSAEHCFQLFLNMFSVQSEQIISQPSLQHQLVG